MFKGFDFPKAPLPPINFRIFIKILNRPTVYYANRGFQAARCCSPTIPKIKERKLTAVKTRRGDAAGTKRGFVRIVSGENSLISQPTIENP